MRSDITNRGLQSDRVILSETLQKATDRLPGNFEHDINEVVLLHGTKPATVPSILYEGLNE